MRGRTKATIAFASMATVGLGVGLGGGYAAGQFPYDDEMGRLERDESELADIENSLLELDYTSDQIVSEVGESCLRYLNMYAPGGRLEDTGENVMVSDLLGLTDQPCGQETSEVRAIARDYVGSLTTLAEKENLAEELDTAISDRKEDLESADIEKALWMSGLGLVGLAIGAGFGSMIYGDMKVSYTGSYSRNDWK